MAVRKVYIHKCSPSWSSRHLYPIGADLLHLALNHIAAETGTRSPVLAPKGYRRLNG